MINEILQAIIQEAIAQRKDLNGWNSGLFNSILALAADHRGEVGERLLAQALIEGGVEGVTREGE